MSNNTISQVTIGPKYFQNEKRAYSNWKSALLRELCQNGTDSRGCSKIEIEASDDGVIVFTDNGCGMDRDTIVNVFMNIGETTKSDGDVGGFGIARNLICFAQKRYVIRTHNLLIEGSGASYTITETPEFRKGCQFQIETGESNTSWSHHITRLLERSNIPQQVEFVGNPVPAKPHRGRFVRTLSFGEVYHNKSGERGIHVRVNGVWMHSHAMPDGIAGTIFVEIDPAKSKAVLTSNRDSLQWKEDREMNAFLTELATETIGALKTRKRSFAKVTQPGNLFSCRRPVVDRKETIPHSESSAASFHAMTMGINHGDIVSKQDVKQVEIIPSSEWELETIDPIISCSAIFNNSEDPKITAIAKKFLPELLTPESTRYKLLATWSVMCQYVARQYVEMQELDSLDYGIGWIFDEPTLNAALVNERYICINPIDSEGRIKYSINKKTDLFAMLTLAIHEMCHFVTAYHNETFAAVMTKLSMRVFPMHSKIFRSIA